PAWSFFVRTNSGIEIQGRVDQAPYEHTITRPRCSFHLHVCTCVHMCANVLHTCFFSFIRLFSLKTALVQCVHFFLTFLIYIHKKAIENRKTANIMLFGAYNPKK